MSFGSFGSADAVGRDALKIEREMSLGENEMREEGTYKAAMSTVF